MKYLFPSLRMHVPFRDILFAEISVRRPSCHLSRHSSGNAQSEPVTENILFISHSQEI